MSKYIELTLCNGDPVTLSNISSIHISSSYGRNVIVICENGEKFHVKESYEEVVLEAKLAEQFLMKKFNSRLRKFIFF